MSIILEGIDMPKECKGIELVFIPKDGDIIYNSESMSIGADRIVEIPTPHGRLIDKDELLSHLKKDPLFDLVERYGVSGVIESRPTILEAEE